MISFINKELLVSTEEWTWKFTLPAKINAIKEKDCGKTFLFNVIQQEKVDKVVTANKDAILNWFTEVTHNKLVVVDNALMLELSVGYEVFDRFINKAIYEGNTLLLFNHDGVGLYIGDSKIIKVNIDIEQRMTTGG